MKKGMIVAICAVIVLVIAGTILFLQRQPMLEKPGRLQINGAELTNAQVTIGDHYAMLPLTEIMKALGMELSWSDEQTAELTYRDKQYVLDISAVSMTEVGKNQNFLLPPPGGQRRYRVEGQELVLDDNTLECMFYLLGEQLHIQIDYEKAIVSVTHSGPP